MPTTRRSSRSSTGGGAKQSTLSFNHRVTKPVPKSAKDAAAASVVTKPSPLSKASKPDDDDTEEKIEQPAKVVETPKVEAAPAAEPDVEEEEEEEVVVPEKSAAEIKAEKMSDAQIAKYWRGIEAERVAKRVHQEDLTVGEKVLRYFDVSSQYGPCIGISRMKRWMRAEKLGLNPPVEALAVLLKEEAAGNKTIERAQMGVIFGLTAVGAD